MKRVPAWKLLVDNGFFPDRDAAERWIFAGKVLSGDNRIDKPGQLVPVGSQIRIKDHDRRFVSRGGIKLEHALTAFSLSPEGRTALDCGASTGGFTDCLLQRGANRVYAVDAGYGQLSGRLRADRRVVNLERTNLSHPCLLRLIPRPEIVTLDLSYLSLRIAIPIAAEILGGIGDIIALVKPLFEVGDLEARRTGIIRDRDTYSQLLRELVHHCASNGYSVTGITHSPIRGGGGSEEYLMSVCVSPEASPHPSQLHTIDHQIDSAVRHWGGDVDQIDLSQK